ncbi:MAG: glutamine synthetase [Candidatus Tectimicrobiota bacterium]|nr:MAG: glutamine synthetase [Candidatus Tectomicrobia bacterium]
METRDVVRQAIEAGVQLVFFLYCDNGGIIRGKGTHVARLEQRLRTGIGLTVAMQAMSDMDQLQAVPGMGPVGEVRLVPDPQTFTVLPYAPKRAVMLADLLTLQGEPWGACPRSFLKRMVQKAAAQGLRLRAAFEPEWTLARRRDDGTVVPIDDSLCFSSVGMTAAQEVVDAIVAALEAQGLEVEQYYPELGHGQQELSIRFADALRAADNQILYRETVRNVAWQHGYLASFAPKPFADQAGNGCHLHFSLWDLAGERNLFYDPEDPLQLSQTAYHFLAGVLAHLPALVALTCPSVNSYRRLGPRTWSSAFVCYGPDNREAALRIASPFWGQEMASLNLELKPADATANPYLALGGLLAAGLDGLARGLQPAEGQRVDVDPATLPPEELARRGIRRLPASLPEAIAALESDATLLEALGPALATSYLAVRRGDAALFASHDEAFELRHHFYKY